LTLGGHIPHIDPKASLEFLRQLFNGTTHPVELRAIPSKARLFTRRPVEAKRFVEERVGENIYCGVVTREDGGTKEHCREVPALWLDLDFRAVPEPEARQQLERFRIPPSIIVKSGGGFHLYWQLRPLVPADAMTVEPLLKGLAKVLGGDPAAAELARCMRLPGTLNHKYNPPRLCQVVEAHWERAHQLADFEPFSNKSSGATGTGAAGEGERIPEGQRNSYLTSLAGTTRRRGFTLAAIEAALMAENAARCDTPLPAEEVRNIARSVAHYEPPKGKDRASGFAWEPESMATLLTDEEPLETLMEGTPIYKGVVTEVFSPRGLGKSLWALGVAVKLAKKHRVLLLDRDNPRGVVESRLRASGVDAAAENLKVITRSKCPPLTQPAPWASFPCEDFDVVILDSLDAAAEGTGEQDSAKPSQAIARLLDIVRRPGGPGLLVLGNCVRTGKHSRGSGVIEDRSDISFEVRDATGFSPKTEDWVKELPLGDAGAWADRNKRRKQREKYRLAFVASKYRVGQEPDPFVVELDLSAEP
jgi:hypothetical protein